MRYFFCQTGPQHGWLSVYDDAGNLLATAEQWWIVSEQEIKRMKAHECKPGEMIPLGDPRWNSHCQWCGTAIEQTKSFYDRGQYHAACYQQMCSDRRGK